jgi:hypothetical protein
MNQKSSFQLPDEDFLAFVTTIKNQCEQNSMPWQIDSARMTMLSSLLTIAVGAYKANKDLASGNHATAMYKKRAFADLKHNTSIFVDYLELNDSVPDEGLAAMHLRPRPGASRYPRRRKLHL